MRAPRSAVPARLAIAAESVAPSAMAVKISSSMAAFKAAESGNARRPSKMRSGVGRFTDGVAIGNLLGRELPLSYTKSREIARLAGGHGLLARGDARWHTFSASRSDRRKPWQGAFGQRVRNEARISSLAFATARYRAGRGGLRPLGLAPGRLPHERRR